jgi:hypothetical protein
MNCKSKKGRRREINKNSGWSEEGEEVYYEVGQQWMGIGSQNEEGE